MRRRCLSPSGRSLTARAIAGLGQNEEAVRAGNRLVEILPETKDAFNGPILQMSLARIHTRIDNHEEAISALVTINGASVHELRLDPTWDALRGHPRFQQLVAKDAVTTRVKS